MCTIYPHTSCSYMFSQFQLCFREPMNLWWSNTQLRVLWYPWVPIKRHGHEEVLQILLNLVERRFYFLMMTPCLLMNPLCRSIPSFATQSTVIDSWPLQWWQWIWCDYEMQGSLPGYCSSPINCIRWIQWSLFNTGALINTDQSSEVHVSRSRNDKYIRSQ